MLELKLLWPGGRWYLSLNKTPGLDGLPNEFYKIFNELLCPFVLLVWQESLSFGALPLSINTGAIKLIHKKGVKDEINNWRPITCLNSVYKILALALSRRISPILDNFILSEQKGFIKGRYILDAITSLWEGADYALVKCVSANAMQASKRARVRGRRRTHTDRVSTFYSQWVEITYMLVVNGRAAGHSKWPFFQHSPTKWPIRQKRV